MTTSKTKKKRKPGRPRLEFDPKIAERICEQIIDGKSLRRICLQKAMPTKKTVLRWLDENPAFAKQYAFATDARGDTYADYITELVEKANENNYNSTRVKIDALKWIASKLKPRRYGDRLSLDAEVTVTAQVPDGDLVRSLVHGLHSEAMKSELPEFTKTQVFILKMVAEQIRMRGGGASNATLDKHPDFHDGQYAELAKGIEEVAKVVESALSSEPTTRARAALPQPPPKPPAEPRELNPLPPEPEPEKKPAGYMDWPGSREEQGLTRDLPAVVRRR